MTFVKFTDVGKNTIPQARVNTNGILSFNQAALRKYHLDGYSHVIMYWDGATRTVGFELTVDSDQDGANRLRRIRTREVDVDARLFLRHFGLDPRGLQEARLRQDPETGWLYMRLAIVPRANVVAARAAGAQVVTPMVARKVDTKTEPRTVDPKPTEPKAVADGSSSRGVRAMLGEFLKDG